MSGPILVTGATGQVGSALTRLAAGRNLVVLDRSGLDLAHPETIVAALARCQPVLVINAAAYTAVDRAEAEPELAQSVNASGVAALAQACAERSIPCFHLSTDYVFDGSGEQPWAESDTPAPLGVYGASKLAGEQALTAILPQHLILRVSWVFGQQGHNFVRTMLRLAAERDELRVVADQWGTPTSAESIARTLLTLADRALAAPDTFPWGLYHYASQHETSWHGFAEVIVQDAYEHGLLSRIPPVRPISTADFPTPARRPANSRLDCRHFCATFGLPQPDWRADLQASLHAWQTECSADSVHL